MVHDIDLGRARDFMESAARAAGATILSCARDAIEVQRKNLHESAIDIVTNADRASEDLLLAMVRDNFPGHDILTEETRTEDRGAPWKWIIDPLDGTVNFSHGYPAYCVSIGLAGPRGLAAGVVYDPLRDECFSGICGAGARLNGEPIKVSLSRELNSSLFATGFPYDRGRSPVNNVAEFSRVVTRVQGIRRGGSAALDLAYVSCGRLDGFWELKLKPWDMAAGMLLVTEAGGKVTDRYGRPTDVYTDSVAATNGLVHEALLELLSE
jgi:myo-inositol-1(or 4)-monophosphatase